MTIRAAIFDRDGVLTDFDRKAGAAFFQSLLGVSQEELVHYWLVWGRKHGFPTNAAEEALFWRGLWDHVIAELKPNEAAREALYRFDYTSFVRPFPDARPALQVARDHGLHTGVLSNFTLATIDESLAAAGLADLIDVAAAAPTIGYPKPQVESYLYVTNRLGVAPEECLFFDDEVPCVEGARRLGMQAYLVERQRTGHDVLQGIVCDLSALPLILEAA